MAQQPSSISWRLEASRGWKLDLGSSYTRAICCIASMKRRLTALEIEFWLLIVLVVGALVAGLWGGLKALL